MVALGAAVLSLRPGGMRQQLRFAARRFRILLVLGGVYIFISALIRIAFTQGFVADYGPALVALALAVVFIFAARDPKAG